MSFRVPLLAGVVIGFAAFAAAQTPTPVLPLQLHINNGRVVLHADNVPLRAILAEWSRLGGAKIINGESVTGTPLTLDLEGVPERQALEIILRGVSGYLLAARQTGTVGVSMYDRLMILPTSVAPRNPPPAVAGTTPGIIRPIAPRQPDDQDADDQDAAQGNDGVPLGRPVPIPRPVVGGAPVATPGGMPIRPPVAVVPDGEQQTPPLVVTPANPFGLPAGSSTRPGVIAPPPPQQATPPRPGAQD